MRDVFQGCQVQEKMPTFIKAMNTFIHVTIVPALNKCNTIKLASKMKKKRLINAAVR